MPEEERDDPTRASMTPLEQQQVQLLEPATHTFWHRVRFDLVAEQVREIGAATVLDVGAGSGMLGEYLERELQPTQAGPVGYRFDESSPVLDEELGQRFGNAARFGRAERVDRNTVTAMLDVIEHIDDDVGVLGSWRARMDPGARLVVTVPALQWAFSAWDSELGHHRRYSRPRLRRSLESAGFGVHRCDYLFPEMLPLLLKRKLVPDSGGDVDMPVLSDRVNRVGYAISSTSARFRRVWPAGTSVVAVAEAPR